MLPLRVLLLREAGCTVDLEDDLAEWKTYEKTYTGIDIEVTEKVIGVEPLLHESFNIVQVSEGKSVELFGLKAIKEKIRPMVQEGTYDAVLFVYDIEDTEFYKNDKNAALAQIANWTYFNPLYAGMTFSEIVTRKSWKPNDPFRVFSHEIRHAYCFRLRALGNPIADVMDSTYAPLLKKNMPYYKEYEPYAPDGNRAVQNILLQPFFELLARRPEVLSFIERLKRQLAALMNQLASMDTTTTDSAGLIKWAEAIKKHEGWIVGSRSYRNFNPANFRLTGYIKSLGALPTGDKDGFAIFPTYGRGWDALLQFLRDARSNSLIAYRNYAKKQGRKICTLADFFQVYAPSSDNNDPDRYAKVVADHIGCTIGTPIDKI